MSETASPASQVHAPRLDLFRDRLDGGVEHHVAQLHDAERIVASLRLEPVRTAPLRTLARIGASVLPQAEGAYASMAGDPDPAGRAGLVLATMAALANRRREADDAFWLAACPVALVPTAVGLGWRPLPNVNDPSVREAVPVVLVVDDAEHFAAIGSPLATVPSRGTPSPTPPRALLDALGVQTSAAGAARVGTGR